MRDEQVFLLALALSHCHVRILPNPRSGVDLDQVFRSPLRETSTTGCYTFPNLAEGAHYVVRLHFNEFVYRSSGSRIFDVNINGVPFLQSFDIGAAFGINSAGIVEADAIAASDGTVAVTLLSDHVGDAICSGIEVLQGIARVQTPLQLRANGSFGQITLTRPGPQGPGRSRVIG